MAEATDDRQFTRVIPGSLVSYPCSPQIEDDWDFRGICLTAPGRVSFDAGAPDPVDDAFARVVVCGAYQLDANYLGLRQRFLERIVIVAVNAATHRAFSGTLASGSPAPLPDPLAGAPPEALVGRSIVGYFNVNLAAVLSLPEGDADYLAYATLGQYVSSVVRIEVRRAS